MEDTKEKKEQVDKIKEEVADIVEADNVSDENAVRESKAESVSEEVKQSLIGTIEDTKFGKMKYISIKSEMEKSYLDYAMSVIVSRALPDVRDGLKPVHRRILYSMHKTGIHWNSSYKKSARIV